jgi:hypothetical protein
VRIIYLRENYYGDLRGMDYRRKKKLEGNGMA